MDLLGRAKKWVKDMGPAEPAEEQPFRVTCPEGHVVRGRRTEGYQALRCPECGAGVFVLPRSPLPMPPTPAARFEEATAAGSPFDDAPIPLADHVPEADVSEEDVPWLEPVEPGEEEAPPSPRYDPVEAAVADLGTADAVPPPPRRPSADRPVRQKGRPTAREEQSSGDRRRPSKASVAGGRIYVEDRPSLGDRLRRNRPALVGMAVAVVLVATVAWSILRNQRRDYPGLVQQARDEGIPALELGDFDTAHRLLSRGAEAVDALGGQIGGAEEVRQAAREAAIYVDLVPDRLEEILDQRARTGDEAEWQRLFERSYRGRSILISAQVTGTPETSDGRFEVNYRILSVGLTSPRQARIDFEGFRLFEAGPPQVGSQVQFGARLATVEADPDGWRFLLQPDSGVTITHLDALRAIGWDAVATADLGRPRGLDPTPHPAVLLTTLLTPPAQDLSGETRERVLEQLGAPRSYARSASQGESIEQWIFEGPSGSRQYINFLKSTGRSGPAVVDEQFFLR